MKSLCGDRGSLRLQISIAAGLLKAFFFYFYFMIHCPLYLSRNSYIDLIPSRTLITDLLSWYYLITPWCWEAVSHRCPTPTAIQCNTVQRHNWSLLRLQTDMMLTEFGAQHITWRRLAVFWWLLRRTLRHARIVWGGVAGVFTRCWMGGPTH